MISSVKQSGKNQMVNAVSLKVGRQGYYIQTHHSSTVGAVWVPEAPEVPEAKAVVRCQTC